ncbi:P-type ATPase [Helcobacillus massiliensis]|uniref:P-type ATPase n=1 Tax=Helcobacillus massiliensis TaxID=521392 RepID=UPI00255671D3|nr:hypothetical protein [Helcobacillus massiliensis]MDK7741653.1 hypothetical protein [Helcobacillus massiliensis]WOO92697.1 hypothetical protein R3I40_09825 [Helcobacillus massiliensis]
MTSHLRALRYRAFSIDLLVTTAVTGALVIGEFVEAGVVAFLFVVGSWLEARTLERTRRSVSDLLDIAPEKADVIPDGRTITGEPVPAEKSEGDLVYAGTMAADGFLTVRADSVGSRTAFSRIYTPGIIVASLIALLITRDIHVALRSS